MVEPGYFVDMNFPQYHMNPHQFQNPHFRNYPQNQNHQSQNFRGQNNIERPLSYSVSPKIRNDQAWEKETIKSEVDNHFNDTNLEFYMAHHPKDSLEYLSSQIKEAISENDELVTKNKFLKSELGVFDRNFLSQMESMMMQKQTLETKMQQRKAPKEVISENKMHSYYTKENKRLEDVIKSYERECEFLKSRIIKCNSKSYQSSPNSNSISKVNDNLMSKNVAELQKGMMELQNENLKLKRLLREKGIFV